MKGTEELKGFFSQLSALMAKAFCFAYFTHPAVTMFTGILTIKRAISFDKTNVHDSDVTFGYEYLSFAFTRARSSSLLNGFLI